MDLLAACSGFRGSLVPGGWVGGDVVGLYDFLRIRIFLEEELALPTNVNHPPFSWPSIRSWNFAFSAVSDMPPVGGMA
jgi:hypothetical protein